MLSNHITLASYYYYESDRHMNFDNCNQQEVISSAMTHSLDTGCGTYYVLSVEEIHWELFSSLLLCDTP